MRMRLLSRPGGVLLAVMALFTPMALGVAGTSAHAAAAPVTWTVLVGSETPNMAVQGERFLPGDVTIDAGDTVTWQANSAEIHTVTFFDGGTVQTSLPPFTGDPSQITPVGRRHDGRTRLQLRDPGHGRPELHPPLPRRRHVHLLLPRPRRHDARRRARAGRRHGLPVHAGGLQRAGCARGACPQRARARADGAGHGRQRQPPGVHRYRRPHRHDDAVLPPQGRHPQGGQGALRQHDVEGRAAHGDLRHGAGGSSSRRRATRPTTGAAS